MSGIEYPKQQKFVVCFGYSMPVGEEEYGQQRICMDCHKQS